MTRTEVAGIVAIVAMASAGGWFAGSRWTEAQQVGTHSSRVSETAGPRLQTAQPVAGNAAAARQGGEFAGCEAVPPRPVAAVTAACPQVEPAEPTAADAARLVQALREGNESQRYRALAQASSDDVAMPDDLLRQLVDTDPSDRVRLAAFKAYADANSNDVDAARAVLDAGRYNHSPAVQAEARKRIEEFERGRSMQPVNDPQTGR